MLDKTRYSRQIILPEVGDEGQSRLLKASVLLVGAGGIGSPAALYLAAAGIGHLAVADGDEVRLSNLNRQILYEESQMGYLKRVAAETRLKKFSSGLTVKSFSKITESNIFQVMAETKCEVVLDCTDNFESRFVINAACAEKGIPFVYGSVLGWTGQMSVFDAKKGPCYQCVYPEPPEDANVQECVRAGVIGVAPGFVGVLEATETIKIILGKKSSLIGKMLLFDLMKSEFKFFDLSKDPKCAICAQ